MGRTRACVDERVLIIRERGAGHDEGEPRIFLPRAGELSVETRPGLSFSEWRDASRDGLRLVDDCVEVEVGVLRQFSDASEGVVDLRSDVVFLAMMHRG